MVWEFFERDRKATSVSLTRRAYSLSYDKLVNISMSLLDRHEIGTPTFIMPMWQQIQQPQPFLISVLSQFNPRNDGNLVAIKLEWASSLRSTLMQSTSKPLCSCFVEFTFLRRSAGHIRCFLCAEECALFAIAILRAVLSLWRKTAAHQTENR